VELLVFSKEEEEDVLPQVVVLLLESAHQEHLPLEDLVRREARKPHQVSFEFDHR